MKIRKKHKKRKIVMKDKEVMVYHCPFKGCPMSKEWFGDTKSLLAHMVDTHSEDEIEKRLRLKKKAVKISPTSDSDGFNLPHSINVFVNDRLLEEVYIEDVGIYDTENEAVLSKCESLINLKNTFGLTFISQEHNSGSSTTLKFKR
ncbi:hypothetical protein DC914_RS25975 [Vibrio parahaemolyticus]|uniref:hypothetical protein n=1 Tax=Vibrio parahaemolyticus TaxID=670 RepID=UPI0006A61691|nr:hypothetical protein [Vibrio parahaemolyticus]EJG0181476.1 hypothetical protein [Vibrio parahaemolyticus]KOF28293.1 hypothetical protein ACX13_16795 [Vibrio parahaemolyticus]